MADSDDAKLGGLERREGDDELTALTVGLRLPWREIENGPSFVGTLQSYRIKHGEQDFNAVTFQSGSPAEAKPLSDLYEPVLVGFATNAFTLRGYERLDTPEGTIGVVQEWQCRDAR